MTNISNMFLAQCRGLETSFRLFYNFIKMPIQRDLANLVPSASFRYKRKAKFGDKGEIWPFLIVDIYHIQLSCITPIQKKGKKDKKENYRSVSILPVLSKIFERIMFIQMSAFLKTFLTNNNADSAKVITPSNVC